jgi:UDP-glucose 4-epimerase
MPHVLVTGGAGFFGGILKRHLLRHRDHVTSLDLAPDPYRHPHLTRITGDVRDPWFLNSVFRRAHYDAVFHCAAVVPHGSYSEDDLWTTNVNATRMIAKTCAQSGVPKLVHISSSCLWGGKPGRAIREDDPPSPVDLYGESKLAAEHELCSFSASVETVILRSPAIVDRAPRGLLAIILDFIHAGKTLWTIGDASNRCQIVFAEDLARACIAALRPGFSGILHIGNPGVRTLRELWQAVIDAAGTGSVIRALPPKPARLALRLASMLGLSSLTPYESRMIADDFFFDTSKIRERLGWRPSLTCEQTLVQIYRDSTSRREQTRPRGQIFDGYGPAPVGVIRLLKWVS